MLFVNICFCIVNCVRVFLTQYIIYVYMNVIIKSVLDMGYIKVSY